MPAIVIDASALGAIVFNEPEGESVTQRLGDSPLAAPALLRFELANICLKKIRKHPDQDEVFLAALRRGLDVRVEIHDVDHADVVPLARSTGLSAYDASYLWLARRLGAELVTLDQALDDAWKGASRSTEVERP
jgi:predicted nucleic acid-binding protein